MLKDKETEIFSNSLLKQQYGIQRGFQTSCLELMTNFTEVTQIKNKLLVLFQSFKVLKQRKC